MPELPETESEASAEKAYAEAAESISVDFPAKAKRVAKPAAPVEAVTAPAEPATKAPAAKVAKPAVAKTTTAKPKAVKAKPAKAKPARVTKAAAKPAKPVKPAVTVKSTPKEKTMTAKTTKTADFTAEMKEAVAGFQGKAKEAYDKASSFLGDYGDFAKGNVSAVVESGKILAAGLQDMGKEYVAESKTAFETLTADVKQLAAVKSPTEFFKLQSDLMRRNLDSAIAYSSKNSEAAIKLANQAFAPISGRINLAVEKIKKAA